MMQGDSYGLPIEILNASDQAVTPEDVSDVEIVVGSLKKTLQAGEIAYDLGKWIFPLSQQETLSFLPSRVKVQVRVKWPTGDVEGVSLGYINIDESMSKEVL